MEGVIRKLRFRGQDRIAIINAPDTHFNRLKKKLSGVQIDRCIDQRYLYEFMIVFVGNSTEIKKHAPVAMHNLDADGVLWFAYPKKGIRSISSDIDRDHGWEPLEDKGFRRVSQVNVDDTWSALRFRNAAYVRSAKKEVI
ncbi:MAG: hypothetical protein R6W67_05930 [Bacteroidales bacterium]